MMISILTIWKTVLFVSITGLFLNSCNGDTKKAAAESKTYALHTVEIKQMKFEPSQLVVKKGDTVLWINHDIVPHDVTEESKQVWTSSLIPANASWSLVVNESAGYYCSIHITMKGKLLVQ